MLGDKPGTSYETELASYKKISSVQDLCCVNVKNILIVPHVFHVVQCNSDMSPFGKHLGSRPGE